MSDFPNCHLETIFIWKPSLRNFLRNFQNCSVETESFTACAATFHSFPWSKTATVGTRVDPWPPRPWKLNGQGIEKCQDILILICYVWYMWYIIFNICVKMYLQCVYGYWHMLPRKKSCKHAQQFKTAWIGDQKASKPTQDNLDDLSAGQLQLQCYCSMFQHFA